MESDDAHSGNIYTPSELNHEARLHLEAGFGRVWIEGEVSNLSRPASGHIYFSLKDAKAQISCALFRSHSHSLGFKPENGMLVRARGRVSLFEARGNYQLIADSLLRAGEGLLRAKLELMKNSLAAEGLFAEAHKKALPAFPYRIVVVTSPSGAALRDILSVLKRRWPLAQVRIYGVAVQGVEAAGEIEQAIATANHHDWAQLIIVTRGGGSLEDLWAFNEEIVARAIFASDLPIVSAVGHEIDFSISDFVADLRAPTPSAAAELISPDQCTLKQSLQMFENRLQQSTQHLLQRVSQQLDHLTHRLSQQHPGQRLLQHRKLLQHIHQRLLLAATRIVPLRQRLLQDLARTLNAVSPLPTLARGYAIVSDAKTGAAISSAGTVQAKQTLITQLRDGQIICTVKTSNETTIEPKR